MINQMLILIIIIILVIGLIYYKFFYYTISDNQNQTEEIQNQEIQTLTNNKTEQNPSTHIEILNYLQTESKLETENPISNSQTCDNLLYKYINLDNLIGESIHSPSPSHSPSSIPSSNSILSPSSIPSSNSILNQEHCINKNQYIDSLMTSNNLAVEYPNQSNIECKKVTNLSYQNPNIINSYLQINSNCENVDNFNNTNKDFLNSNNIIKTIFNNNNLDLNNPDSNNPSLIENFLTNPENKTQRIIWIYWENINRNNYPTYIKLCLDTMKKHLNLLHNLIFLNEKTVKNYLPDLRDDFNNLKVAQKVDYYRIALLHKYGGIWIDADIIVMRDFDPIFQKLDEGYDYVGFGCTGYECSYGYFTPSNWVMGSKKNSILMAKCLEKLNKKLDLRNINEEQNDSTYHDYGKTILWDSLNELKPLGYNYYHFTSEYDGARDKNKNWIHVNNFFSTNKTEFLNVSKLMFVVLYNSEFASDPKYKWIYDCDESRLLNGNEWICSLYRKSLKIDDGQKN